MNMQELNQKKEQIISLIKTKGPSLPIHISSAINVSPLITSAFLSELIKDQKLKISSMKVGNSPLYFLSGQKQMLENFVEYLNLKEQQAFNLLRQEKILMDGKQEPAIRVALRSLGDFAIPLKVRISEEIILFWKYYLLSEYEAREIIQKITTTPDEKLEQPILTPKLEQPKPVQLQITHQATLQKQTQKPKKKITQEYEFTKKIKEYLKARDIEILEVLTEKKKEFAAKIRTDISFGKQSYFLTAKEKKNITENDLAIALQKSQAEKMPALILSTGELNKKAQLYRREWYNLLKFEKLNF